MRPGSSFRMLTLCFDSRVYHYYQTIIEIGAHDCFCSLCQALLDVQEVAFTLHTEYI